MLPWLPCCSLYVSGGARWPVSRAQRLILINGDSHASAAVVPTNTRRVPALAAAVSWPWLQPSYCAAQPTRRSSDACAAYTRTRNRNDCALRLVLACATCLCTQLWPPLDSISTRLYAEPLRAHARSHPRTTMFARVAARVSRACAMNDSLVASGAVDTKLMWQVPRLALAPLTLLPLVVAAVALFRTGLHVTLLRYVCTAVLEALGPDASEQAPTDGPEQRHSERRAQAWTPHRST